MKLVFGSLSRRRIVFCSLSYLLPTSTFCFLRFFNDCDVFLIFGVLDLLVLYFQFSNAWFRRCRVVKTACYSLLPPPPVVLQRSSAHNYDLPRISVSARGKPAFTKMDVPRVTSPPCIHLNGFDGMDGPDRSSSRSITTPFQTTMQRPMAIPNSPADHYVPPALPPPRYIEEIAAGDEQGIQWRNSFNSASIESGGSVSSRSSLRGNWHQKMAGGRGNGKPDYNRRTSLASSLQSQPEADTNYDFSRNFDEGYHSLSGSSLINQSVQTNFLEMRSRTCWAVTQAMPCGRACRPLLI